MIVLVRKNTKLAAVKLAGHTLWQRVTITNLIK